MIDDRDRDHNRTQDMKAFLAVRSMRKGIVPDAVEALERDYHRWLGIAFNDDGLLYTEGNWLTRLKWWTIWKLGRVPATIFRQQVERLAIAYNAELMREAGREQQREHAADYIRVSEQIRDLHKFLYKHWPAETLAAEDRKVSNFDLVKELLLGKVPPPAPGPIVSPFSSDGNPSDRTPPQTAVLPDPPPETAMVDVPAIRTVSSNEDEE